MSDYLNHGGIAPINEKPMTLERRAYLLELFGPLGVVINQGSSLKMYTGGQYYNSIDCS